jgi:acetolactate synthase-1/2/3 large subunit
MTMQEMSTAVQYEAADQDLHPQQPVHGHGAPVAAAAARQPLSQSYSEALPDFVKLAEAYRLRRHPGDDPSELDGAIEEMIDGQGPVIFDCLVANLENCFPMIPSGKAHNEMILPDFAGQTSDIIDAKGKQLV